MDTVLRYMRNHSFNDSNSPTHIEGVNGALIQSFVKTFIAQGYVDVYTPSQPPILKSYSLSSAGELFLDVEGGYVGKLKKQMWGYKFVKWTFIVTLIILAVSLYQIIKDCKGEKNINKPQNNQQGQLQAKPPMSSTNSPYSPDTANLSSLPPLNKGTAKQKGMPLKAVRKP